MKWMTILIKKIIFVCIPTFIDINECRLHFHEQITGSPRGQIKRNVVLL